MMSNETPIIRNKKILIFGGTGSLGKTLIDRYVDENEVIVYSRDEAKQWTLRNENKDRLWSYCPDVITLPAPLPPGLPREIFIGPPTGLRCEIGDIRDAKRVQEVIYKYVPDIIIIASALKQVDTCELAPLESIKTNILGIQNVVDAVSPISFGTTVLMVSTDKACSPINVYGMCKSIAERVVLEKFKRPGKFIAVRYGNVLESRGSIIPLFKYQAEHNDCFTLTHQDMTRFIMTLDQSVDLISHAIVNGKSGETWIPSLPSMRIYDLASIFSEEHGKPIKVTGMRPGEKIHEALINHSESFRIIKPKRHGYYILNSVFEPIVNGNPFEYTSNDSLLSKEQLKVHLAKVLNTPMENFIGKKIEEIRT